MPLTLPDEEAHVWWLRSDASMSPRLLATYRAMLDEDERHRADRMMFEKDRNTFTAAHALVRNALSRYSAIGPEQWRFATDARGRPRVIGPETGIDFNLSHTDGLAACVIARGMEVGIDTENITRPAPFEIAATLFAPDEAGALNRLPANERQRRFFEYWTLKEAYAKARGLGLSLAMDQFSFHFDEAVDRRMRQLRLSVAGAEDDQSSRWQFELHEPTSDHLVAIALRQLPGPGLDGGAPARGGRIIVRELVSN